jgi:Na+/H+ antiporter NhaA
VVGSLEPGEHWSWWVVDQVGVRGHRPPRPRGAVGWLGRLTPSRTARRGSRRLQTPLRQFLRTETGGAAVLLAAAVAALVWVNLDASSYAVWLLLPMLAAIGGMAAAVAIGGMAAAVAIYLGFDLGGVTAHGWGIAMSTDTALALGLLGLPGRRVPDRLRHSSSRWSWSTTSWRWW